MTFYCITSVMKSKKGRICKEQDTSEHAVTRQVCVEKEARKVKEKELDCKKNRKRKRLIRIYYLRFI